MYIDLGDEERNFQEMSNHSNQSCIPGSDLSLGSDIVAQLGGLHGVLAPTIRTTLRNLKEIA